jgi:hypothetical protein
MTDQEVADLEAILALNHEKCIKQFVLNVRKNAKYHSNLQKANQFTAKNVMLIKSHEDFN